MPELRSHLHPVQGLATSGARAVAPFDVQVVATGKDEAVFEEAERIGRELELQGFDVLVAHPGEGTPGSCHRRKGLHTDHKAVI